jgi:hypothetical protein
MLPKKEDSDENSDLKIELRSSCTACYIEMMILTGECYYFGYIDWNTIYFQRISFTKRDLQTITSCDGGGMGDSSGFGDFVSYGHNHGQYSSGVPSAGDLYAFLEMAISNKYLNSMYVYGTGWEGAMETYAINVNDREAINAFLERYPKESEWNSFTHAFMKGGKVGSEYNDIKIRYNRVGYDIHGASYHYMEDAVALSYIMDHFNMGVTLTRKVDKSSVNGGAFGTINVKDKGVKDKTLDITICK